MQVCPQGQSDRLANNGSAAGKPKKLCRQCGDQFTRITPRGKPLAMKVYAVLWYLSGISMHRIAFLPRVSAQSVLNWLRTVAQEHYEKPEPTSRAIILELDEMWYYLKQKRRKLWIWKALDRDTGQLLDWECSRRDKATVVFALWLLILFLIVRLEGGELRRRSFSRPGSAIAIMFQSSMALPRDLPTPRQSNVGPYQTTWGQPSSSSPHLQGNVATTSHRVIPGTLHAGE